MARALYLIRHGHTDWTRQGRFQGQSDIPLADDTREVAALAPVVGRFGVPHWISSDLRRCSDTSSILGYPAARKLEIWRERSVGIWSGRLVAEVERDDPGILESWESGDYCPSGGETIAEFEDRIRRAYKELEVLGDGDIAVVTHANVIRTLMITMLSASKASLRNPDPASVTIVNTAGTPTLHVYNWRPDMHGSEALRPGA